MESSVDKATQIKREILNHLEKNGPSLPVPIASELKINTSFSSAFLSELLDDEIVKISSLKVGGSPLYYLPQHEILLENFTKYLPGKEKEALNILKEKLVVKDLGLEPALRIALRSIKDFSYPVIIEINNQKVLYWRYFTIKESEAIEKIKELMKGQTHPIIEPPAQQPQVQETPQQQVQQPPAPQVQQQVQETPIEKQEKIQEKKELAPILKEEKQEEKPKLKAKEPKINAFFEKIQTIVSSLGLEITEKLESKKNY